MFIRIRIPTKSAEEMSIGVPSCYPHRPTSWITSLLIHAGTVTLMFVLPPTRPDSKTPVLDELVKPESHKIIFYDFRKKPVEVEPLTKVGTFPRPRGEEASNQAIIATAPKAKSTQQTIWLPTPKLEIKQDLPVPNMVARMNTAVPSLPAPPAPPKPQPVVETPKPVQPNPTPPQPKGDVNHAPEPPIEAAKPLKEARTFVPPPPSPTKPKLTVPTLISDAPAPVVGSPSSASRLPVGTGMPVLQGTAPPPPTAPVAPVANVGNGTVDVAVASLHPADTKGNLPEGERPGRFSKAPETGTPASGDIGKTAALTVPNLTIREEKPKPVKPLPEPNSRAILYTERVRSIPVSTLSVPLRPSSRTIPRAVEGRFQGRNVYTMVVPIENLPTYGGDWIVWFAERQPVPGATPVMRAPLPYRKTEPADQNGSGSSGAERIQISGILAKDGKLGTIGVTSRAGAAIDQALIQDLESWEFKPATRDGVPIDVEVVIEIPFNFPPNIAKRATP
jgi:hypothetical protein